MSDSDLHPTRSTSDATTKTLKRKPMALKLTPETIVNLQVGGILTCAGGIVVATIFVWTIKTNGDQALSEIKSMREEQRPVIEKVHRLWSDYEWRIATGKNAALPGVQP
jgi:hypothetical protein